MNAKMSGFLNVFSGGGFPHLEDNLLARLKAEDIHAVRAAFPAAFSSEVIAKAKKKRSRFNLSRGSAEAMVDCELGEIGVQLPNPQDEVSRVRLFVLLPLV